MEEVKPWKAQPESHEPSDARAPDRAPETTMNDDPSPWRA